MLCWSISSSLLQVHCQTLNQALISPGPVARHTQPELEKKTSVLLVITEKNNPFLKIISDPFVPVCHQFWCRNLGIMEERLMKVSLLHSLSIREGKKHELIAFLPGRLKWKQLNEVRQLASLRIATVPNCDLKYAHNPLIWQRQRFLGRY